MLDRRVERVGERELRDRLADDRQQRARALELDRERLPPFAGAQRVGGADGEDAEPVEQRVARVRLVGEQQLQRALRRLAELQRHDGAAFLQRLDRERAGHVARAADGVERDRRRKRRARERGQHRALLLVAPDDAGARAGRLGRERRHLVGGAGLVGAGRQRVAGEAEQVGRSGGRAASVAEGPPGERDLVGGREGERALALDELAPAAKQLQRADDRVALANRELQHSARTELLGRTQQRRRQLVALLERLGRDRRAPGAANPRARPAAPPTRHAPHARRASPESSTSRTTTTSAPVTSAVRAAIDAQRPVEACKIARFAVSPPWSEPHQSTGLLNSARGPAGATARRGGAARPDGDPAELPAPADQAPRPRGAGPREDPRRACASGSCCSPCSALSVGLAVVIWNQIEQLFGL